MRLGLRIEIDPQQRHQVDLLLHAARHAAHERLHVERLRHLAAYEIDLFGSHVAQVLEDLALLVFVDLAIALGGSDHRAQHDLGLQVLVGRGFGNRLTAQRLVEHAAQAATRTRLSAATAAQTVEQTSQPAGGRSTTTGQHAAQHAAQPPDRLLGTALAGRATQRTAQAPEQSAQCSQTAHTAEPARLRIGRWLGAGRCPAKPAEHAAQVTEPTRCGLGRAACTRAPVDHLADAACHHRADGDLGQCSEQVHAC
ncbi:MAG: hypothetical protein R3E68_02285 [Burkholderiaceae bacterium]